MPDKWDTVKKYDKYRFGAELMSYPYKSDFLWGILDHSPHEKNFFFLERRHNRDCDNWSRMWYWWAKYKCFPVWEICIMDGLKIWTAHKLTITKINDKYAVFDYYYRNSYNTFEEAIKSRNRSVWAISKKSTP